MAHELRILNEALLHEKAKSNPPRKRENKGMHKHIHVSATANKVLFKFFKDLEDIALKNYNTTGRTTELYKIFHASNTLYIEQHWIRPIFTALDFYGFTSYEIPKSSIQFDTKRLYTCDIVVDVPLGSNINRDDMNQISKHIRSIDKWVKPNIRLSGDKLTINASFGMTDATHWDMPAHLKALGYSER
jgi:hypothetical protein